MDGPSYRVRVNTRWWDEDHGRYQERTHFYGPYDQIGTAKGMLTRQEREYNTYHKTRYDATFTLEQSGEWSTV